MKRDLFDVLTKWVTTSKRKPVILRGARQVGKSWLAREIGKIFDTFIEINFEKNPEIALFFQGNLDIHQITKNISNYYKKKDNSRKNTTIL